MCEKYYSFYTVNSLILLFFFIIIKCGIYDPQEVFEYQDKLMDIKEQVLMDVVMAVSETTYSTQVEELSVTQRGCKFPQDAGLATTPIYTYKMCLIECRYKIIRETCGCHPHFARPIGAIFSL